MMLKVMPCHFSTLKRQIQYYFLWFIDLQPLPLAQCGQLT